jgi:hypothetical protein
MNKDAILATIIGFIIGLIITGCILIGPKIVHLLPKIHISLPSITLFQSKPTPKVTNVQKEFSVAIDSPLADSIESEKDVLVSGNTVSGSTIVIEGNTTEAIVTVNDDGKYAGKITLIEGKNDITVTSYLKDKKATQTVTVFYTPETL